MLIVSQVFRTKIGAPCSWLFFRFFFPLDIFFLFLLSTESQFHCHRNLHFRRQFLCPNKIQNPPLTSDIALRHVKSSSVIEPKNKYSCVCVCVCTYLTCASLRQAICDSSSAMRRFSCCINVLSSISSFLLRSKNAGILNAVWSELLLNSCMAIMQY